MKRTRDSNILDTCDIVVDVGAVYDESKQRFDHHQRGFMEVFGHGFTTKLSSAGLVYKSVYSCLRRPSSVDDPFTDTSVERLSLTSYNLVPTTQKSKVFG